MAGCWWWVLTTNSCSGHGYGVTLDHCSRRKVSVEVCGRVEDDTTLYHAAAAMSTQYVVTSQCVLYLTHASKEA
ncbi:hypothetical protein BGZ63DRAFT_120502 [Mariannaea sp. PMI_226]|nr:hypothetical protein BGZ63DRAFT_120502 [Mariannaea sp. PMI_226]